MTRQLALLVLAVLALSPSHGAAQFPPDSFTNLKVLPRNINQRDLMGVMRGFSFALGVNCQYCHGGADNAPLDSIKFAADIKRQKATAREMLRMVSAINTNHLANVPERPAPAVEVRCMTCHRGLARPALIEDVLTRELSERGPEQAVATYRELRAKYYGSAAYDLSADALNEFGLSLIRQRRFSHAAPLLALSAELNPRSLAAHLYLGEARRAMGDTAQAIASYRKGLEIEPTNALLRRLLQQLGAQP